MCAGGKVDMTEAKTLCEQVVYNVHNVNTCIAHIVAMSTHVSRQLVQMLRTQQYQMDERIVYVLLFFVLFYYYQLFFAVHFGTFILWNDVTLWIDFWRLPRHN
jgi:hypothetical protein